MDRLDSYVQHTTNCVEQPTMRVDLLLVLRFQYQNNLNRHEVVGVISRWKDELRRGINR